MQQRRFPNGARTGAATFPRCYPRTPGQKRKPCGFARRSYRTICPVAAAGRVGNVPDTRLVRYVLSADHKHPPGAAGINAQHARQCAPVGV
jgi:hypothetical protein